MGEVETFDLHRKQVKIAMQQWLKLWQPPVQSRLECPFCHSLKVGKRAASKNGNTLCCANCRQDFSEEALPGCRCWYPGALLKCHECSNYKEMMEFVAERLKDLQSLSEADLDAITLQPDFYQRNFTSKDVKESQNNEPIRNWTVDLVDGIPTQLTLFEDV